jgi:cell division protein ZapB
MEDKQFNELSHKIDELIQLASSLDKENRLLKSQASDWQQEREQLVENTEIARNRVEAMISRLKTLEQEP